MLEGMRTIRFAAFVLGAALMPSCNCGDHSVGDVGMPTVPRSAPELDPSANRASPAALQDAIERLTRYHDSIRAPAPGDWLFEHNEPGQSFDEYRRQDPVTPDLDDSGRRKLYIQPLGPLTATERKIVGLAGDYMGRFFGLPVVVKDGLPLSIVSPKARRVHPQSGTEQFLTSYILQDVLAPRLPDDASAFISFTSSDLWPGDGWNFVFGHASLRERVGVWSMHRNGDPDAGDPQFKRVLLRTLKIAVHETGHMFSMHHCIARACVMNGANSLKESDEHPLWLCPQCMAKVSWAGQLDPVLRYERLFEFAESHGFRREAQLFRQSIDALR